jgi:hypothetical protein
LFRRVHWRGGGGGFAVLVGGVLEPPVVKWLADVILRTYGWAPKVADVIHSIRAHIRAVVPYIVIDPVRYSRTRCFTS